MPLGIVVCVSFSVSVSISVYVGLNASSPIVVLQAFDTFQHLNVDVVGVAEF